MAGCTFSLKMTQEKEPKKGGIKKGEGEGEGESRFVDGNQSLHLIGMIMSVLGRMVDNGRRGNFVRTENERRGARDIVKCRVKGKDKDGRK